MNTPKFSSILVFTAAMAAMTSGAFATELTNVQSARAVNQWQDMTSIASIKTRAEVRSELKQAASSPVRAQQEYVDFARQPVSNVTTRAEVKTGIMQSSINTILQPGDVYFGG
jgi:hypothetical protein